MTNASAIQTRTIPYGPGHRCELAAFCGLEDVNTYGGSASCLPLLSSENMCGIGVMSYRLPDGRVLVCRTDRYTSYTHASIWLDHTSWSQWWYTDRRRGDIDPETGRPFSK